MSRVASLLLLAAVAFGFALLLTSQVKTQLIPASNQVARNQALIRNVQSLEQTNTERRHRIDQLRDQISQLQQQAAAKSQDAQGAGAQLADLKQAAGLTALRGPGVVLSLDRGHPLSGDASRQGYLVTYEDIQDCVNLLFASGAEGIAVNGDRLSPLSYFGGVPGAIEIDQGSPLVGPYTIAAIGDQIDMKAALSQGPSLGDLKNRERVFGLKLAWTGEPDIELPAYDGSLAAAHLAPSER